MISLKFYFILNKNKKSGSLLWEEAEHRTNFLLLPYDDVSTTYLQKDARERNLTLANIFWWEHLLMNQCMLMERASSQNNLLLTCRCTEPAVQLLLFASHPFLLQACMLRWYSNLSRYTEVLVRCSSETPSRFSIRYSAGVWRCQLKRDPTSSLPLPALSVFHPPSAGYPPSWGQSIYRSSRRADGGSW